MSFLQPAVLIALPLAALPIIIHLIHLYRRRQVKWAAMIFLRSAQQMNKGLSRLRQILILALRVIAVAAIILVAGRPLAGGWLGLTGGAPDTVLILVDRSASMEQKDIATGVSKREEGLRNLAKAVKDTTGGRSRLVLIDSALGKPLALDNADSLLEVPQTGATETAADIPALLQAALDYITTNKTGRTDIWLLSDLQQSDWDPSGGRWQPLRAAFGLLQGVRFHLLCYPEPAPNDLSISVDQLYRRETAENAELLHGPAHHAPIPHFHKSGPGRYPVAFRGQRHFHRGQGDDEGKPTAARGILDPDRQIDQARLGTRRVARRFLPGQRRVLFRFDEPPPLRSAIVSDDVAQAGPLKAALSAAADPDRKYIATVYDASHAAEIPWADTALVVWQAPLPKPGDAIARQLAGPRCRGPRDPLFTARVAGQIGVVRDALDGLESGRSRQNPPSPQWWRNDSDLLANTRDGAALPVGTLEIPALLPGRG